MRHFIDILSESQSWWDFPHDTIDKLASLKDSFLQNPGIDVDHGNMGDYIPETISDGDTENEIAEKFFDFTLETFRQISKSGKVKIYRAISVKNIEKFLEKTLRGKAVGNHWSYDDGCASTQYHSEAPLQHEIMLVAYAPLSSIDWGTSMQAHFNHPHEMEIFVSGPITLIYVEDIADGGKNYGEFNAVIKA